MKINRVGFALALVAAMAFTASLPVHAIDLLPDFLKKLKFNDKVWSEEEQFVALAPQSEGGTAAAPNSHPAKFDAKDLRDALSSLEFWPEGGFLRSATAEHVFGEGQATLIATYAVDALRKAKPNEDVIFNVRGYDNIAFDTVKERQWTSGRLFIVDGKLNVIIGSYRLKKDRGIRNAEAAHGTLDDYSDMYFDPGTRDRMTAKMQGRVAATAGVTFSAAGPEARPDWVVIDIPTAVADYRDRQVAPEEKERNAKAKQETAKLTMERREMREEMARMRQEIKDLKSGGAGKDTRSLEDRLATLQELRKKELISEQEYKRRRDQILNDI